MKNSRTPGSATVVTVLVLAVALIGVLGYVLWGHFVQPKASERDQVISETSTPKSPDSVLGDKESLKIDDWKIEFTIPDALKDTSIQYHEKNSSDTPPVEGYVFTTSRIKEIGGKCAESPFGDTVQLMRYTEDPGPHPHSLWVSQGKIGGYFYVLTAGIAGCSMFNDMGEMVSPASQIELDDRSALVELIKTLKSEE